MPVLVKDLMGSGERLGITQVSGLAEPDHSVNCVQVYQGREPKDDRVKSLSQAVVILPPPPGPTARSVTHNKGLSRSAFQYTLRCVGLAERQRIPESFLHFSEVAGATVFSSRYDAFLLKSRLLGIIREKGEQKTMVHGVLVRVSGRGVLIMGESGIGKTACGMELVARGGAWIADDAIVLERRGDFLYGRGHERTRRMIAVRGQGIIRAEKLLGMGRVRQESRVDLIVRFRREAEKGQIGDKENRPTLEIMGVSLHYRCLVGFGGPGRMAGQMADAVGVLLAAYPREEFQNTSQPNGTNKCGTLQPAYRAHAGFAFGRVHPAGERV